MWKRQLLINFISKLNFYLLLLCLSKFFRVLCVLRAAITCIKIKMEYSFGFDGLFIENDKIMMHEFVNI